MKKISVLIIALMVCCGCGAKKTVCQPPNEDVLATKITVTHTEKSMENVNFVFTVTISDKEDIEEVKGFLDEYFEPFTSVAGVTLNQKPSEDQKLIFFSIDINLKKVDREVLLEALPGFFNPEEVDFAESLDPANFFAGLEKIGYNCSN